MDDSGEAGEFGSVLQLHFVTVSRYFNNFAVSTATECLALIIQVLWSLGLARSELKIQDASVANASIAGKSTVPLRSTAV